MSQIKNKILSTDEMNIENKFINFSPLPKPDLSRIEQKESNFSYKQIGSYKKQKSYIPESPMKTPNHKYYTPVKMQSNLFGNLSTARKLNFNTNMNESDKYNNNPLMEKFEEEEFSPSPGRCRQGERKVSKMELICTDIDMEDIKKEECI
jgi:hypothetical protein